MKYYTLLTEDEIQKVCSIYPHKELVNGFRKCSKDFSALMPGHRPQAVQGEAGRKLLMSNPRSRLTAKMVEVLLSVWVPQVTKAIEQYIEEGKSKEIAYIFALSKVGFVDIAHIYFHLVGADIPEREIDIIIQGAKALDIERKESVSKKELLAVQSELSAEIEKHKNEINSKDRTISRQTSDIKRITHELEESKKQVALLSSELEKKEEIQQQLDMTARELVLLGTQKGDLEASNALLQKTIEKLQSECSLAEEKKQRIIAEKAEALVQLELFKERLRAIDEENTELNSRTYLASQDELQPRNMDDFIEYLQYNFSDIGIDSSRDDMRILMQYLCYILFQNKPIICNRRIGITIAQCVSNALCGSAPLVIPYSKDITNKGLITLLSNDNRVIILDSFLGNYNESEFLSVLGSTKKKIIFATVTYDHTITYLPQDVLLHCNYLNVDRIGEFFVATSLSEDPSVIPEELIKPTYIEANRIARRLCKEIAKQLEYEDVYAEYLSAQMVSEEKLIAYLLFSILPYYTVVHKTSPYAKSERLEKYAGALGTCPQKDLLMRWFGNE